MPELNVLKTIHGLGDKRDDVMKQIATPTALHKSMIKTAVENMQAEPAAQATFREQVSDNREVPGTHR